MPAQNYILGVSIVSNRPDLPPAVQLHISDYVRNAIADAGPDDSPPCCYSCPLWGLRVDLAQLRLMRRLELGGI